MPHKATMAINYKLLFALVLFALIISLGHSESTDDGSNDDDSGDDDGGPSSSLSRFNRSSFPSDFVFGAATSAYQIEGASDLRGINIWDKFTATIANRSNASVAADSYHRYKEDVSLLSGLGFDAYRFSISWTRLLPTGRRSGGISADGVRYYNDLIDEIRSKDLQPFATIFHWDLPQTLEDEYKGFLSENIVADFASYADLCFSLFGKKVKHWITLNEPWSYATAGYAYGTFPPNRCSKRDKFNSIKEGFRVGRFANYDEGQPGCEHGNSGTEPYIVTHNLLLSHAAAVKVYRETYQSFQRGQIGITLVTEWFEPYAPTYYSDVDAARRSLAFMFGWYMDPLFTGAYPTEMVTYVGNRLPTFNETEAAMVKGSYDFIGLNYYTAEYAKDIACNKSQQNYGTDPCVHPTQIKNGKPIGEEKCSWLYVYPTGIQKLLVYIKDKYNNPPIYVTENGVCRYNLGDRPKDMIRIKYHRSHLYKLRFVINQKLVNLKGYFAWSVIDNFEWLDGYFVNFGVIRVDYENNSRNRSCKDSATWFNGFLNKDGNIKKANICDLFPDNGN
ncbi:hypothetical protein ACH5RR_000762 [Cinchona calisaya]|uniref:Uncharacterized protein n=1 Tax=Cinchona calisaya TaxID=153742 RepID=A0ABD3B222_9GENT